jgi:hypothetical protein
METSRNFIISGSESLGRSRNAKLWNSTQNFVMLMMFRVAVFWVVTPCIAVSGHQRFRSPEDRGSMGFWNVGVLSQHCTVSQLRRPRFEMS